MTTFFDGFIDQSKTLFSKKREVQGLSNSICCFDARTFAEIFSSSLDVLRTIDLIDLRLVAKHDGNLVSLARKLNVPSLYQLENFQKRFSSNIHAIKEAKINLRSVPLNETFPEDFLSEYTECRISALSEILSRFGPEEISEYRKFIRPVFWDLLEVERSGIKVDENQIEALSSARDLLAHEKRFLESIVIRDGFTFTKINPNGSRTGRFKTDGGFDAMTIPKGRCRSVVTSRFENGLIVSLDFNAIDYRSLVNFAGDAPLQRFFKDEPDFHAKTTSLFGDLSLRDTVKKITYTHVYGGKTETIAKQTSLPEDQIKSMIFRLDDLFLPLTKFREEIGEQSRKDGFLTTLDGRKVRVDPEDHDGKIIGLFAQSYSSGIFNKSIRIALKELKSFSGKLIFLVHDEMVFDIPEEELPSISLIKEKIEQETGFVVKIRKGKNYYEATK